MRKNLYILAFSLLLCVPLVAQTSPSAEGPGVSFWVGASVSMFNPDYGCSSNSPFSCWDHQLIGLGPYLDTSSFLFGRISAEGEAHFMRWHGPAELTEDSYLAGPRVRIYHHKNLHLTGKFLLGAGRFTVPPPNVGTGNYFVCAPGAAMDYRVARRLSARLDYEYQFWPSFKGLATGSGHGGLTPNGLSLGVSYAIR
jgi:hypothetical protein